jgi:hypothetical protein
MHRAGRVPLAKSSTIERFCPSTCFGLFDLGASAAPRSGRRHGGAAAHGATPEASMSAPSFRPGAETAPPKAKDDGANAGAQRLREMIPALSFLLPNCPWKASGGRRYVRFDLLSLTLFHLNYTICFPRVPADLARRAESSGWARAAPRPAGQARPSSRGASSVSSRPGLPPRRAGRSPKKGAWIWLK